MSMFSAIDAEVDRGIVKRIINAKKKELRKAFISKRRLLSTEDVIAILNDVLKKCEEQIQE